MNHTTVEREVHISRPSVNTRIGESEEHLRRPLVNT
jgi:hypothetical protein